MQGGVLRLQLQAQYMPFRVWYPGKRQLGDVMQSQVLYTATDLETITQMTARLAIDDEKHIAIPGNRVVGRPASTAC